MASELLSSVTAEDVGHYLVRLEELFVSEGLAAARVEAEGAVTTAEDEAEGDEAETGGAAGQHRKRLVRVQRLEHFRVAYTDRCGCRGAITSVRVQSLQLVSMSLHCRRCGPRTIWFPPCAWTA